MRATRDISKRMRDILTHDKVGIKDGFASAMTKDVQKVLGDYFELDSPVRVEVVQGADGRYAVTVSCTAYCIKQFDTTYDVKRY